MQETSPIRKDINLMNDPADTSTVAPPKHPALRRRLAIAGLTAALFTGGATAAALGAPVISGAQDQTTETTAPAATDPAPADPGATDPATGAPDQERPDPSERLAEVLAPLVEDGTLTQAQLDAVVTTLVEAGPPMGGHGGPGMGHGRGMHLETAAEALGVTAEELRTELQAGSSIADVAAEKGVDVQTVIDAMVAELKTHLDEEVAAGEHTQEEADERLAEATERITAMVNGERPADGPGFGPHGPRGDAPGDESTDSTDSTD